jgi:hypothetical protein
MADLISEIAWRLRERAQRNEGWAQIEETTAPKRRQYAALLNELAARLLTGETFDGPTVIEAAVPPDYHLRVRTIDEDIADLLRVLGRDGAAVANAIAKLP